MSYKKFRSLSKTNSEQGLVEFSVDFSKDNRDQFHSDYEKYNILKDLIRHGKKDMIRMCIEKGFPVNIDREDKSFDGTPLHVAVLSECPEIVQLLIDSGSCIYKSNGNEETPLLLSAIAGIDKVTDLLLSHIEPKEYFNGEGFSHFHVACMRNQVELIHQFLISGTDIHQSVKKDSQYWSGFTPLHFAVEYRSIETVEFLVKNGADVTIKNGQDLTPLHLAFRKRNRKMIDILLSVQCFFPHNPVDREGLSHFHIACAINYEGVVKDYTEKALKLMVSNEIHYEAHNWSSYDAFRFAICNNCINVLQYLLKCVNKNVLKNEEIGVLSDVILDHAYLHGCPKILNLIISHFEKNMVKYQCTPLHENYSDQNEDSSNGAQLKSSENKIEHFDTFEMSLQTKLHVAVLLKDNKSVTSLLENCHSSIITKTDARGKTPLHLAFEANHIEIVKQLLDIHLKIDENPVDNNGLSHFHFACSTDNLKVVENFLKKGVDIESPIKMDSPIWAGCTPLHFAAWFRQTKVGKLLMKHGANFAAKNASKLSPFEFAIPGVISLSYKSSKVIIDCKDEWELVEDMVLVNYDRKVQEFDDRGITPLHIAAMNNDVRKVKSLTNADTINKRTDSNLPPWYAGLTPLHFAAWFDNKEAVEILLDRGADFTIQSVKKRTPAHSCWRKLLCKKVGRRLLFCPKNVSDGEGVSLFHLACKTKNIKAVQHFLELKVDVDEPILFECDFEGKTPLHLAVEVDDSNIVKLLLDHGANVNARDRYFNTPISLCRSTAVLQILLEAGADPQALDYCCETVLNSALYYCKSGDFITALIANGWDINTSIKRSLETTTDGRFVLMRHIESLMVLIEYNVMGINLKEHVIDLYRYLSNSPRTLRRVSLTFKEICAIKLNSMKEVKIDSRTTLYDILSKSSRDMVIYCKNETFRKVIESEEDLRRNYSMYAYLVILQFKRGQKRANLQEQGKTSLNLIANKWLGDLVLENILQFLNDYEIQYLIYATSGQDILPKQKDLSF